jgi:NAD(P)H-hydrate epimerase
LGCTTSEVEADRFAAVQALCRRYAPVAVLKGAGTLIAGESHRPLALCSDGNPGMASGGMGDVLTGVIAAFIAQGHSLEDAAELGVSLHGAAGDRAAQQGEKGVLASDLIEQLRPVLNGV